MKKHIVYKTEGVCASKIEFDLEDGRVYHVQFHGGCKGNVQGDRQTGRWTGSRGTDPFM